MISSLIYINCLIMFNQSRREVVGTVIPGDEKKVVNIRGIDGRFNRIYAWTCNRRRRKTADKVGIIRGSYF